MRPRGPVTITSGPSQTLRLNVLDAPYLLPKQHPLIELPC